MKDVATMKVELKKLIDTAAGRIPADGAENRISKAVLCPAQSVFTRDP